MREGCSNYDFAREFHASRLQPELQYPGSIEATETAMEVADLASEEQAPNEAQGWVAQVPVQTRHCAFCDPASEPVAHDEVCAIAETLNKRHQGGEVIAVVRVAHDDVTTTGGFDPG
jgi:hypothetical protein